MAALRGEGAAEGVEADGGVVALAAHLRLEGEGALEGVHAQVVPLRRAPLVRRGPAGEGGVRQGAVEGILRSKAVGFLTKRGRYCF